MSDLHENYTSIQSLRIKNLEQQVELLQGELQILRDGILQQNDIDKLVDLKKRLMELNATLVEHRTIYNSVQETIQKRNLNAADNTNIYKDQLEKFAVNSSSLNDEYANNWFARENAGFHQSESFTEPLKEDIFINEKIGRHNETVNNRDTFKTCKQLMDEIKSPGSILGNYFLRLQDFQADPELRRQRWERKQQKKLLQLQMKNHAKVPLEDKATITEESDIITSIKGADSSNYLCSPLEVTSSQNIGRLIINSNIDNSTIGQYIGTDANPSLDMPIISRNLSETIEKIIGNTDKRSVVLSLVLESDIYHLTISYISNGQQVACFLATEEAVQEAQQQHLFEDYLTFFVVNAENSKSQKHRVLGHVFEFIKIDCKNAANGVE